MTSPIKTTKGFLYQTFLLNANVFYETFPLNINKIKNNGGKN